MLEGETTLYELGATEILALAFCLADNQEKNIEGMAEAGTLINMGWGSEWGEERFCKETDELVNNCPPMKKMSKLDQKLVDGKGTERISKMIMEYTEGQDGKK